MEMEQIKLAMCSHGQSQHLTLKSSDSCKLCSTKCMTKVVNFIPSTNLTKGTSEILLGTYSSLFLSVFYAQ